MTSEQTHDIVEQPSPTCPMIDEVIDMLNDVQRAIRGYEREEDPASLRSMIDDVERALFRGWKTDVESRLEAIRKHVESIRAWGEEWKALALEHVPENEAA